MRQEEEMSADEKQLKIEEQQTSCCDSSIQMNSTLAPSLTLATQTPKKLKSQKEVSKNEVKINHLEKQVMPLTSQLLENDTTKLFCHNKNIYHHLYF